MTQDELKRLVAEAALAHVPRGAVIGVGSGSTVNHFIDVLAEHPGSIAGAVSSSAASTARLVARGLPVLDAGAVESLPLCVDGADEIDAAGCMIKGGGAALTREKIVADLAERFLCIADESKLVARLGRFPLPVEVVPFGLEATRILMLRLAGEAGLPQHLVLRRRPDGHVFVTDGGHHIIDCHFQRIDDPAALAAGLVAIPGVVEHGLFLGLAQAAWVADPGTARLVTPARS